ncbi:zinc finger and BTB domain-containing protein 12 [Malurus melanocephalus]|uniref:zinc finger and BTB domain-containing protein 12 n=1 Tax=Malurus melanocephalus TaxID=175006 RepID=UPI002547DDD8|nr:zinc finger and BTB domain-containing protein 12 [Malurus melanocephalus]
MSSCAEVLRFQLPGHEAAALRSMTRLRAEERFCDVTIVARSLRFRGHRVILAACSPFLRDQFLLNPAAELRVSLAHSARVLADLLLSCYTGALEFAGRDLVNYLTAASYLQMEHVVERCRGALARFIQAPPAPPPPPKTEEDEEDEDEEDAAPDVCIVKVEPAAVTAATQPRRRKGTRLWASGAAEAAAAAQGTGAVVAAGPAVVMAAQETPCPPQLGVVKACYSLAEDAEGEGLLIFPGGGVGEEPSGGVGSAGSSGATAGPALTAPTPSPSSSRCGKCGETFQGVEKLVFHMRAQHFVFMCPRCGKQFNHSSNLNRHMNVHRGVKSHGCGVCGKSFTQKSTLHDHLNLHSGARPYRCSYCDVRFAHKPAIRRHLKEQHGKTTAQNVLEAGAAEGGVLLR